MKTSKRSIDLNKWQGILLLIGFLLIIKNTSAQDTFSICAVDPVTGQVGSAGATCIASSATSAIIISDVHPGVGVVHTQAAYLGVNQIRARNYMNLGYTPQQIIDSAVAHDFQSNPSIRQYGVVSLDSGGLSAAFTGVGCMDYKNHITGPTYSIQGNILLGQQILDSMEARFINTSGNLACKLMAALQGAKVVGADTRCNSFGISSFSSFIRVANPGDSAGNLFLDITVNTYPNQIEPIDTLQSLFDLWGGCAASYVPLPNGVEGIKYYPNPVKDFLTLDLSAEETSALLFNTSGVLIRKIQCSSSKTKINFEDISPGIYFLRIYSEDGGILTLKIVRA